MKNIHILPTTPNDEAAKGIWIKETRDWCNIYITSDEEIKEDYVIVYGLVIKVMMFDKETLYFVNGTKAKKEDCKKIILTTDPELIKDGVQAIDDEFLKWFVKNPSCEFVQVEKGKMKLNDDGQEYGFPDMSLYKIIIPKEVQKQNLIDMMQDDEKLGLYDKPKQTAVEWLLDNLISEPYSEEDFEHNKECWIKAKEMGKNQIIDAWNNAAIDATYGNKYKSFEQYYNETYEK